MYLESSKHITILYNKNTTN